MHNALRWFLLWVLFPFVIVAADPPPPLVRSVLSTNLPPFGLTGQALFRTANLPYLDWSNIVQQVIDTNAFQPASTILTNLSNTGALTNPAAFQPSSTTLSNLAGTGALTNGGAFIGSAAGGLGTNTQIYGDANGTNWTLFSSGGVLNTNKSGGYVLERNGSLTASGPTNYTGTNVAIQVGTPTSSNSPAIRILNTDSNGVTQTGTILIEKSDVVGSNPRLVIRSDTPSSGFNSIRLQVPNDSSSHTGIYFHGTNSSAITFRQSAANGYGIINVRSSEMQDFSTNVDESTWSQNGKLTIFSGVGTFQLKNPQPIYYAPTVGAGVEIAYLTTNATQGGSAGLESFLTYDRDNSRYVPTKWATDNFWLYCSNVVRLVVLRTGYVGIGTNSPQSALHVVGDNSVANATIIQTTNRFIQRWDTNGNSYLAGAFSPTNGIINQGSASSIANITITTNSTQIWCLNGTNQLVTLPDCTKVPAYQIYRFSSTNGNSIVIFTNATGTQTIRDGTSLSMEHIGVGEVGFFTDGAAWFLSSKTKTIWPNASWSTSTNVPLTVAGSNYVTYNQLETSNGQGISLTNGYQIYVRDFGQYLFTFSIVTQIGAPNATNRIWLQQSGQNVPRTRTDVKMSSTAEQYVMTVNFILPVTTNLTWFGLCVRSTDNGAQLVTGAAADATMPAMPSAIVTVNKISDTFP